MKEKKLLRVRLIISLIQFYFYTLNFLLLLLCHQITNTHTHTHERIGEQWKELILFLMANESERRHAKKMNREAIAINHFCQSQQQTNERSNEKKDGKAKTRERAIKKTGKEKAAIAKIRSAQC